MVTPKSFAESLLRAEGINPTPQAVANVVAWEAQEGGHWNNTARYNPLNTTLPEPGAGNTGSQGNIKVYTGWSQGLQATAATLRNYPGILKTLKDGASLSTFEAAVNESPWGTHFSGGALPTSSAAGTQITSTSAAANIPTSSPGGGGGGFSDTLEQLGVKALLYLALLAGGGALLWYGTKSGLAPRKTA